MAKDNLEVEIKVKVTGNKFIKIKNFLKKKATFVKKINHLDTYYSPKVNSFLKPKYPYKWLSIRERNNKLLLNYKHWYPEGAKDTTHCDEYETEVLNQRDLDRILNALGVEKIVKVEKQREVYVYQKSIEVALDKVKGLGFFIEAESLNNFGGVDKTHKKLSEFMKLLGIKKIVGVPGGYAAEMMRRKGLMK